jgi:radical SAM superfamily enzyme YgiQ (UPF0313 family)
MDLLLTHGYCLYEDPHERAVMKPYPPLGLLYLSSHLKAKGFAVDVFDTTFARSEALHAFIRRERPPVVGLYATLMTRRPVLDAIRVCKSVGSIVVLGGPEPAPHAEAYLARGADVIVSGEGEQTLEELVPHLSRHGVARLGGIRGVIYRADDGTVVRTEPRPQLRDLDTQPFPDRAAIDIARYVAVWRQHHGLGSVSLIAGRGCPYTCTWCSHAVFGHSHRQRGAANVADEVEDILARYRPDMLWYADDVFTLQPRWIAAYAAELKRRGLRIPFETISREDRLNQDIVATLAEMGCQRLWIGSESGSQRVLDRMSRKTDAARVREMVKLLQRHGIEAGLFIMLGYEGEETIDIEETVDHLKSANPDVFVTTVSYPIKGTPYYDEVADRVVSLKPWHEASDRETTITGRHSRRFYSFATRWMVNEVALHREQASPRPRYRHVAKRYLNARLGRLGMRLTAREIEHG